MVFLLVSKVVVPGPFSPNENQVHGEKSFRAGSFGSFNLQDCARSGDVWNVMGRLANTIDNFGLRLLLSFCLAGYEKRLSTFTEKILSSRGQSKLTVGVGGRSV
jgi:hypothetical protein